MLLDLYRALKRAFGHVITPRRHTDSQAELLNLISAPIYLYTITTVVYYTVFHTLPYYYGNAGISDVRNGFVIKEQEHESWSLFWNRSLAILIYFQMMANWMNIRLVSNAPNRKLSKVSCADCEMGPDLSVNNVNQMMNESSGRKNNQSVIPGPVSAPPPPRKKSYWSWKSCDICVINTPPRCHHCPMCETCILKRDHHCFFAGKCVGFYNQRHFIVFLMWASFGTTYATLHFIPFLFTVLLPRNSYADIFPPFALIRWLLFNGNYQITNYMFAYFFNAFFVMLSTYFLLEQYGLIGIGLTQFENNKLNKNKMTITDPRTFPEKLRAVMGYNYGISIIFPLTHWFIKPHENPYEWPEHKIYKH